MTTIISQSMIHDVREYDKGEKCGLILKTKFIDKQEINDTSDSMALGQYFEYIFSGQKTKFGHIPQPEYTVAGLKKDPKDRLPADMYAPYKLAHENADRLKALFKTMKWEIVDAGKRIEKDGMDGTLDLKVKGVIPRKIVTIDLKYSGLLEDRWSKFGWGAMRDPGTNLQKEYKSIQAKQYHYLDGDPFFFLVVSNKNNTGIELFQCQDFDDFTMEQHVLVVNAIRERWDLLKEVGMNNFPLLQRCNDCPLKATCPDRETKIKPVLVNLNDE